MPLFEFECKECGHREEKLLQRVALHQTIWCGDCGGQMERLPNASNFALKGDGWTPKHYPKESK